jgi:hypothetical protein
MAIHFQEDGTEKAEPNRSLRAGNLKLSRRGCAPCGSAKRWIAIRAEKRARIPEIFPSPPRKDGFRLMLGSQTGSKV